MRASSTLHLIGSTLGLLSNTQPSLSQAQDAEARKGLKHAFIAVVMFSLTVPFTEMALASFSPASIAFSRGGIAGVVSLMFVMYMTAMGAWRLPVGREWLWLALGGICVCFVFPYTLSAAMQSWQAADMGVALAGIPLLTGIVASVLFAERHSRGFWISVMVGTLALMVFSVIKAQTVDAPWQALVAVLSAAVGYSFGGRVAKSFGGFQTICWMCLLYLPISSLGMGYSIGQDARLNDGVWSSNALYGLLYLAIVSQWLGFHFWYGAMAKIGVAKVGPVQLLQPFFTLLFAVALLGERLYGYQVLFAGVIALAVFSAMKSK